MSCPTRKNGACAPKSRANDVAIFRYNPAALPPATLLLVVLNVGLGLVDSFQDAALERALWARGIDIHYGQWWRIPGCALVHANWIHLAFNAYGIWVLGRLFEQLQGWRAVLVVYVVSALGGAALGVTFNDPGVPMLGASGAAYGLMGAVLGFFYVKTGSVSGIMQVPAGRQLAIWFLIGIGISLGPGISLLGHLGGFVPGALLGIYFEQRYARKADLYHHLSAGLLCLLVAGFCAYSAWPVHSGNLRAARALAAFEQGDMERGDALLKEAASRGTSGGGSQLVRHLAQWRKGQAQDPVRFNLDVLRWPLTHVQPDPGLQGQPWGYLEAQD